MIILLVQAEKQILYLHFDAKPRTFEVWTTGQCFSCSFTKTRRSRGQISSVVDTFWLVLTYDLFEDRRIDDVVVKTFFPPYILILFYIKQIDSALLCFCSVIDHKGRQNVVRTSVTHSAAPRVPLLCSYHILTLSVTHYWTDARQLGIYLLNSLLCEWE